MRLFFPLLLLLAVLLTASCRRDKADAVTTAKQKIVLMLDAAHGGTDSGAVSADGEVMEKTQVLRMCTRMQMLASAYNIDVRLVRTADTTLSVSERISIVNSQNPQLLLSLHVRKMNPMNDTANNFEAIISPSSAGYQESKKLSLTILSRFVLSGRSILSTERDVLLQNGVNCPSVILECGNIDNAANKALIKDEAQTEQLCREILAGVVEYANTE